MTFRGISRRSIAARLAPFGAGLGALAVAVALPLLGPAAAAPLNTALSAEDIAPSALPSGFAAELAETQGTSCVLDFDRDGVSDLLLSTHGEGWRLLRGTGTGSYVEAQRFPATDRHGCAVGDFGGISASGAYIGPDGRPDLYVTTGTCRGTCVSPNELWLQRPDGTYVPPGQDSRAPGAKPRPNAGADAAMAFGVADERGRGREPLALDVNRDGLMDLFVGNDEGVPGEAQSPNRLFLNRGGRFEEQLLPGGRPHVEVGSLCSAAGDYDGDGWTDLLNCSDVDYGRLQIYRNHGDGVLQDVAEALGVGGIGDVKDAELVDVNGDGRLDLVLLRWSGVELRLNRAGAFGTVDYSRKVSGGSGLGVGDADGDRLPDLYVVLLENDANGEGDDLLLRNAGVADPDGDWAFEEVPIPLVRIGNGDTATAIPNWGGTNRTAFLVSNGRWTQRGPWQLIFMVGPSTGPPLPDPGDPPPDPGDPPPGPGDPPSDPDPNPGEPPGEPGPAPPPGQPGGSDPGPGGGRTPLGADPDAGGRSGAKVTLSIAQLRINQRIAQAAVRRVNALTALTEGRPAPERKESGGDGEFRLTRGQLLINQRISQAAVRRVNALQRRLDGLAPERATGERSGGQVTLSATQLLINQRISQAAVRRVNALADRVSPSGPGGAAIKSLSASASASAACGCPACCGIAPGSLTASAGGAAVAATAGQARAPAAGIGRALRTTAWA